MKVLLYVKENLMTVNSHGHLCGKVFSAPKHSKFKRFGRRGKLRILSDYLGTMPIRDARAFLAMRDSQGISVMEHAHGLFFWAPYTAAEGHKRISAGLEKPLASLGRKHLKAMLPDSLVSDSLFLFDLETVWFAPGKRGHYLAMEALLHASVCDGFWSQSFFDDLIDLARNGECVEKMQIATVAAMVSVLWRGVEPSLLQAYTDSCIKMIDSLELSRALLMAPGDEQGHTLLHCPLPVPFLRYLQPKLLPEDISVKTKAGRLPAECWLERISHIGCATHPFRKGLDFLFEMGASVDFSGNKNSIPAVVSACMNESMLRALLKIGADASLADPQGRTAFSDFTNLSPEMIRELAAHGADVNHPGGPGGRPLTVAMAKKASRMDRVLSPSFLTLLELGWDVNARDQKGETPIFHATKEEIEALFENGADVTVHNVNGGNQSVNVNPLVSFITRFHELPPACLLVPENLCSVSAQVLYDSISIAHTTALGWAVTRNSASATIAALVEAGANIDGAPGVDGCLPPILCANQVTAGIRLLIRMGAKMPDVVPRPMRRELEEDLRRLVAERVGSFTKGV